MALNWMTPYHVMAEGGDEGLRPMSELCNYDPSFSVPDMQARVSNLTIQLLFGFGDGDMTPLKPYVTEDLLEEFRRQAAEWAKNGRTLNVVRPVVLRTEMLGFEIENGEAYVHVRTQTRAVLYATDPRGKVVEGSRERLQAFEGTVIAKRNGSSRETFTVRRVSYGVGVERTFPLHSPRVDHIEVIRRGKVRRAKLYYLRNLQGKAAKIKEAGRR